MKTILTLLFFAVSVMNAAALEGTGSNPHDHYVRPYDTSRGVHVPGHYQTNPNGTQRDNYETHPNINPHNGNMGTHSADH